MRRRKRYFKLVTVIIILVIGSSTGKCRISDEQVKIEDSQIVIDVQNYYYNQLTQEEKEMYKVLDSSKQKILQNEKICLGKVSEYDDKEKTRNIYVRVVWAYRLDNPLAAIWLNKYKGFRVPDTLEIILEPDEDGKYYEFANERELQQAIEMVETKTKEFVQQLKGTNRQKFEKIQEWLLTDLKYDDTLEQSNISNVFGCMIQKRAVCSGFTYAFKYVADMAQLPTIAVIGTTRQEKEITHAWSILFMEGKWYVSDLARKLNNISEDNIFYSKANYCPWKMFDVPNYPK